MIAFGHYRRVWYVKDASFPPGHPWADDPADGCYQFQEEAQRAKEIIVELFEETIPEPLLVVTFEDIPGY